jgi:anti-sigma factor (TIGR02949 family)
MPHADLMSCAEVLALLPDHVDRELDAEAAAGVDAHLAGCVTCAAERRAEQQVLSELRRRVQEVRMPAAVRERLWASLRRAAAEESAPAVVRVTER